MKKRLAIYISLILLIIFIYLFRFTAFLKKDPYLKINGQLIKVEIASGDQSRTKGLSDRLKLDPDTGMLFIFPVKNFYSFWMKDMRFPLDLIWISEDTVAEFIENAPPEGSNPQKIYIAPKPVNKVLEVNAGTVQKLNIQIGDKIEFKNIP